MTDFKPGDQFVVVNDYDKDYSDMIGSTGIIVGPSPFTGKDFSIILDDRSEQFEARHGELKLLRFAVGDRVRLVQDFDDEGSLNLGDEGTVAELAPYGHEADYEVHWDGLSPFDSCFVQDEELGSTEAWSPKVGDRVKLARKTGLAYIDTHVPVGTTGTVEKALGLNFENPWYVTAWDNGKRISVYRDTIETAEDPATEEKEESTPEFTVGQRVRLVTNYGEIPSGTEGTVEQIEPGHLMVDFDFHPDEGALFTFPNEVEPVTEKDPVDAAIEEIVDVFDFVTALFTNPELPVEEHEVVVYDLLKLQKLFDGVADQVDTSTEDGKNLATAFRGMVPVIMTNKNREAVFEALADIV